MAASEALSKFLDLPFAFSPFRPLFFIFMSPLFAAHSLGFMLMWKVSTKISQIVKLSETKYGWFIAEQELYSSQLKVFFGLFLRSVWTMFIRVSLECQHPALNVRCQSCVPAVENWWRHKWYVKAVTGGSVVIGVKKIRMRSSQNVNSLVLA